MHPHLPSDIRLVLDQPPSTRDVLEAFGIAVLLVASVIAIVGFLTYVTYP